MKGYRTVLAALVLARQGAVKLYLSIQGEKQTQFLGQTAPLSSDENQQFPNFNPRNKDFQTK